MEAYRVLSKDDLRANYDAQYGGSSRASRFDHLDHMDRDRYPENFHQSTYNYAQEILKARAREKYYEE